MAKKLDMQHRFERAAFSPNLLFRGRQPTVAMGFGAWLSGAKLAFLSRLSTTGGTWHCKRFFLGDFHSHIMQRGSAISCSIVTSQRSRKSFSRHSPQGRTRIADMKLCIQ
jgi:hypothetical protein